MSMEIAFINDVKVEVVLKAINDVNNSLTNIYSGSPGATLYDRYIFWTAEAKRTLGSVLPIEEVKRLVESSKYWVLIETNNFSASNITALIYSEIDERKMELAKVASLLVVQIEEWSGFDGVLVIADTSFYLHTDEYFTHFKWHEMLSIRTDIEIRVVVPIRVIDELDRMKSSNKSIPVSDANLEPVRTRARLTLKKINNLFEKVDSTPTLNIGVNSSENTSMKLYMDSLSHVSLEDGDTEILDRSLRLKEKAQKRLIILTRDAGMHLRAKSIGLESKLLID